MASAAAIRSNDVSRQFRQTCTEVTMDSSYPTGGEVITAADLGLRVVQQAVSSIKTAATTAATEAWYDIANGKLKVNNTTGQVANGGDLSSVVIQVIAWGY